MQELQNPVTKTIPRDQSELIEELAYAHETIEHLSRYSKCVLESLVEDECGDEDVSGNVIAYAQWLFHDYSEEHRCKIVSFLVDIGNSEENFSLARRLAAISRERVRKLCGMSRDSSGSDLWRYSAGFKWLEARFEGDSFLCSCAADYYSTCPEVLEGERTALIEVMNAYNTIDRSKIT